MATIPYIIEQLYGHNQEHLDNFAAHNFDVNLLDEYNQSLLYQAVWKGHTDWVKILIDHGADIHVKSALGSDAISTAAARGFLEPFELLIDAGANIHHTYYDDENSGMGLLSNTIKGAIYYYYVSLRDLKKRDHLKVIERLITLGIDVNQKDDMGNTPLMYSAFSHDPAIPLLLLKHNADHLIKNQGGNTASDIGAGVVADVILSLNEKGLLNNMIKEGDPDNSVQITF